MSKVYFFDDYNQIWESDNVPEDQGIEVIKRLHGQISGDFTKGEDYFFIPILPKFTDVFFGEISLNQTVEHEHIVFKKRTKLYKHGRQEIL